MQVQAYHWPKNQSISEDYLTHFTKVSALFEYNPQEEQSWIRRAHWLDQSTRPSADRERVVECLTRYNEHIGNTSETIGSISKLLQPETLVIVGGQQTGLFGGPLLVIYKAITLIQAAKDASIRLKRTVLPLFWMAGEDHDFAEVNHIHILNPQADIDIIKIESTTEVRTSVSRMQIDQWEQAIKQLGDTLQQTEFKAMLLDKLSEIGKDSQSLVDFFGKWMVWLFGEHGLILLNSDDVELRKCEGAMFLRFLEEQQPLNQALYEAAEKITNSGYVVQAELTANNANLFVFMEDGERVLLQWDGELFSDKKKERMFSKEQLAEWLIDTPERFSNNVMTRPLMQDYLFPVLGTVLGSSEIAYWALTRSAFETFGMQMPILLPRLEFTLIEGTTKKHMDKYGLSFETAVGDYESWKRNWLAEQDELGLEASFAVVKEQFANSYDPLLKTIAGINLGLLKLGETNKQKIIEQIQFLEARAVEANLAQFEAALRQLGKIRLLLLPFGKPQERVYNMIAYLNKYGTGLTQQLIELPYEITGIHRIVYL